MEVDSEVVVTEEAKQTQNKKDRVKQIVQQIYIQLTKGCGREFCTNADCASNKVAWKDKKMSQNEAFKIGIQFVKTLNTNPNTLKLCSSHIRPSTIQEKEVKVLEDTDPEEILRRYKEVFSCPFSLSFSFLKDEESYLETDIHNIDFDAVQDYYKKLETAFGEEKMVEVYLEAGKEFYNKYKDSLAEVEEPWIFRAIFIIMQNPLLFNPMCHILIDTIAISTLVGCFSNFKNRRETILGWISNFESNRILDHVQKIQSSMTIQIFNQSFTSENIHNSIDALDIYNTANELKPETERLNYIEFYNDGVNREIELATQYEKWVKGIDYCKANDLDYKKSINFTLCNYPWLLDTTSKGEILKYEAKAEMKKYEYQDLANMFIMGMVSENFQANESDYIYLKLEISRDTIVEDTLNHLIREDVNMKKKLKIVFKEELGQDEGGVQKEFFQILVRELFKPGFTMFTYYPESKFVWFNGNTYESNLKFELIGALMGLAIYNQIILDIHFPTACFKKLLDIEPNLNDLKEMIPSTGQSLQYILDCDSPTLEHDLYLTFVYEYEVFGENKVEELKENGAQIYVNQQNKQEYADLLINFIFNRAMRQQFTSFYKGFHNACGGLALTLFRPKELQGLICGTKVLDFASMKRETRYDGYEGDEEVLEWFWDILLNELAYDQQKKFLFFCTGCDKAPISGLENINFIIVKHGEEDDKLPCAQTCFNLLLLPEYSSRDRLKQVLLLAIDNSEGFGML